MYVYPKKIVMDIKGPVNTFYMDFHKVKAHQVLHIDAAFFLPKKQ